MNLISVVALVIIGVGVLLLLLLQITRRNTFEEERLIWKQLSSTSPRELRYAPERAGPPRKPDEDDFDYACRNLSYLQSHLQDNLNKNRAKERVTLIMQAVISLLVLCSALYIIVFLKDAETSVKDWAYGGAGTVIGFWLRF
jgi:hypothetical protein